MFEVSQTTQLQTSLLEINLIFVLKWSNSQAKLILRPKQPSGPVHGTAMIFNCNEERTSHKAERDFTCLLIICL